MPVGVAANLLPSVPLSGAGSDLDLCNFWVQSLLKCPNDKSKQGVQCSRGRAALQARLPDAPCGGESSRACLPDVRRTHLRLNETVA